MLLRSAIACIAYCEEDRDRWPRHPLAPYFGRSFRNGNKDCSGCRNEFYVGNAAGHEVNSPLCPQCEKTIIKRVYLTTLFHNAKRDVCEFCGYKILRHTEIR
ncbi:hypothetical protein HKBW3S44_00451 [Candidatus Hakubella thermalkaliphila]|uniref:Uncharacterized protein n=2 Tax=Candidatus Hakubella thermalkaliphila TaxID=2754717 RepID=A0A6V8PX88_9ACTN|nr:hypothetical protein [Actinomycetota bacterium]GFP27824.1 hypothetical protein HKBW3S33_01234 [Candidatus Hakubella thermalkaliphila]GFP30275.1 hypothetical protein HKBW3S34_01196 [Candidatus Hakubella thermalkaliphila]GFP36770.1 hypothetical protein HKBW3S44_00451 [Candidatus Hakubella thermalkaliphila]GFP38857.1 hypothetical protein HKBW3S47_00557 [Candidatus Hakubella thermalkaliphila]